MDMRLVCPAGCGTAPSFAALRFVSLSALYLTKRKVKPDRKDMLMLSAVVYRIPLIGWMLKEAVLGSTTAKVLFIVNLVLIWLLAIYLFGYPAIILPALAAVPAMFVVLILIMMG